MKKRRSHTIAGNLGAAAQGQVKRVVAGSSFDALKPKIAEEYSYNRDSSRN